MLLTPVQSAVFVLRNARHVPDYVEAAWSLVWAEYQQRCAEEGLLPTRLPDGEEREFLARPAPRWVRAAEAESARSGADLSKARLHRLRWAQTDAFFLACPDHRVDYPVSEGCGLCEARMAAAEVPLGSPAPGRHRGRPVREVPPPEEQARRVIEQAAHRMGAER